MSRQNSGKGKSTYQAPDSDDEAPSPTLLDEGDAPRFNPEPIAIDDDYGGEEVDPSHERWLHDSAIRAANDIRFIESLSAPQIQQLAKYVFQSPLYAVRRGLYPGVYRNWGSALRVVDNWMPNGRFGATRSGSLRRFNCPIQAWRFVSRDDWGGSGSYDNTNTSAALQSLPPPAGFTIPAPMIIATAGGALQHLEPPIPPPEVEAGEPLPLLNGDNNDPRRLPAGVCVGDARVHYHRINGEIVLCGPTNRPSQVVSIRTVVQGVPGYPSIISNNTSVWPISTSSSPAATSPSASPIRTPASRARVSTLSQVMASPTRPQTRVPSGSSTFSSSQPLPSPSMPSQPRASTSQATTSSQPSSSRVRASGSGPHVGAVSRSSSQASDSNNVEVSVPREEYQRLLLESQHYRRMMAPPQCSCRCNPQFPELMCQCCAGRCLH
ncbi:hypothetical protein FRC09_001174 [Ceratobasidium sp. 395]|nr:hypothetical protein FRC09_001174 [Ceratobasidium sp. 395]